MEKTNLVIVESPAKAKTIGKYLGPGYTVKASMGHVRDLPKSKLGVDLDHGFKPDYQPIPGKEDTIKDLKKAAKNSEKVFLATDPDREGEAISWHLKELLGIPDEKTYRVTFNEITKKVVTESIAHPRPIDQDLVDAQQARRILDRIVGYQLSPLLWRKIRRGLSAGRVQSVATRLVVEREEEIRAFIPQEYWTIDVKLNRLVPRVGSFLAHYHGTDGKKRELNSQAEADAVLADVQDAAFVVSQVKRTEKRRQPAPPFNTSSLQQEASRKLNMTPRRTMAVAQQLYEGVDIEGLGTVGLITYMRTDSLRLSEEAVSAARSIIKSRYGADYCPPEPRQFKTKSNAQDAHEAIRPSDVTLTPEMVRKSLTAEQNRLYKLIWSRFLSCQMANAVYDNVSIDVTAGPHLFRATHSALKFSGFTAVYEEGQDDEEARHNTPLPDLSPREQLDCISSSKAQHFTQPPARFTEASLIRMLEEQGIGRPSTYAPTVSTILDRYYVLKEGKALRPTPLGEVVTGLMKDKFTDIVDPSFTAHMEESLDQVETGKQNWIQVLDSFYSGFHNELETAERELDGTRIPIPTEQSDEVCDLCGSPMVVKIGKFGRFLACSNWPDCSFSKPIPIVMPGRCPKCSSRLLKKTSRKGYTFYGCERNRVTSGTPCDFMTWDVPVQDNCPECGQTMFKLSGRGAKKPFCINPECGLFLPEDQRGYRRKPRSEDENRKPTGAEEKELTAGASLKAGAKPARSAKKAPSRMKEASTRAKKSEAKVSATKKSASGTVAAKPKRQLSEAQKAALAAGRAKAKANREAAKDRKTEV